MQPNLSFVPRYHELADGTSGQVWMPMYNPNRACVAEERHLIEAHGGVVETNPVKLEPLTRRPNQAPVRAGRETAEAVSATISICYFFASVIGLALISWLSPSWLSASQPLWTSIVVMGTGVIVLAIAFAAMAGSCLALKAIRGAKSAMR